MSPRPANPVSPAAVTLLALLGLAIAYFALLRPAATEATELDATLTNLWHRIVLSNETTVACVGVTPENFEQRLKALNQAQDDVGAARRLIDARIALPTNVLAALRQPFQLLDFQRTRQQIAERLMAEAKKHGCAFLPDATNGLPRYRARAEIADPAVLWAWLFLSEQALRSAALCRVKQVKLLQQLPSPGLAAGSDADGYLELPVQMELNGDLESVVRLLSCLPLRGEEFDRIGLPQVLTNKPALFISRLLARKAAPDRPKEVQVEMVVSGFVPVRGQARPEGGG